MGSLIIARAGGLPKRKQLGDAGRLVVFRGGKGDNARKVQAWREWQRTYFAGSFHHGLIRWILASTASRSLPSLALASFGFSLDSLWARVAAAFDLTFIMDVIPGGC